MSLNMELIETNELVDKASSLIELVHPSEKSRIKDIINKLEKNKKKEKEYERKIKLINRLSLGILHKWGGKREHHYKIFLIEEILDILKNNISYPILEYEILMLFPFVLSFIDEKHFDIKLIFDRSYFKFKSCPRIYIIRIENEMEDILKELNILHIHLEVIKITHSHNLLQTCVTVRIWDTEKKEKIEEKLFSIQSENVKKRKFFLVKKESKKGIVPYLIKLEKKEQNITCHFSKEITQDELISELGISEDMCTLEVRDNQKIWVIMSPDINWINNMYDIIISKEHFLSKIIYFSSTKHKIKNFEEFNFGPYIRIDKYLMKKMGSDMLKKYYIEFKNTKSTWVIRSIIDQIIKFFKKNLVKYEIKISYDLYNKIESLIKSEDPYDFNTIYVVEEFQKEIIFYKKFKVKNVLKNTKKLFDFDDCINNYITKNQNKKIMKIKDDTKKKLKIIYYFLKQIKAKTDLNKLNESKDVINSLENLINMLNTKKYSFEQEFSGNDIEKEEEGTNEENKDEEVKENDSESKKEGKKKKQNWFTKKFTKKKKGDGEKSDKSSKKNESSNSKRTSKKKKMNKLKQKIIDSNKTDDILFYYYILKYTSKYLNNDIKIDDKNISNLIISLIKEIGDFLRNKSRVYYAHITNLDIQPKIKDYFEIYKIDDENLFGLVPKTNNFGNILQGIKLQTLEYIKDTKIPNNVDNNENINPIYKIVFGEKLPFGSGDEDYTKKIIHYILSKEINSHTESDKNDIDIEILNVKVNTILNKSRTAITISVKKKWAETFEFIITAYKDPIFIYLINSRIDEKGGGIHISNCTISNNTLEKYKYLSDKEYDKLRQNIKIEKNTFSSLLVNDDKEFKKRTIDHLKEHGQHIIKHMIRLEKDKNNEQHIYFTNEFGVIAKLSDILNYILLINYFKYGVQYNDSIFTIINIIKNKDDSLFKTNNEMETNEINTDEDFHTKIDLLENITPKKKSRPNISKRKNPKCVEFKIIMITILLSLLFLLINIGLYFAYLAFQKKIVYAIFLSVTPIEIWLIVFSRCFCRKKNTYNKNTICFEDKIYLKEDEKERQKKMFWREFLLGYIILLLYTISIAILNRLVINNKMIFELDAISTVREISVVK